MQELKKSLKLQLCKKRYQELMQIIHDIARSIDYDITNDKQCIDT